MMDNSNITGIGPQAGAYPTPPKKPRIIPQELRTPQAADRVTFGGQQLTQEQSLQILVERSIEQLKGVVGEARAALGLPEDAVIDTSPEATAQRITDFALGAFEFWRENHAELDDATAREQYAELVGGAIDQGIEEARGILQALHALGPDTDAKIDETHDLIKQTLADFVKGESSEA